MSRTYNISELASEFDVTTRTIRFYEDKGLITPERRGQTRIYSGADRTKLKLILRGKRLGFSLEESRRIIEMYHPGDSNIEQLKVLLEGIRERKSLLERQLSDIEFMMVDLNESEQSCLDAMAEIKVKQAKPQKKK
jgi:DNA-binding transcriptional MerR regulator